VALVQRHRKRLVKDAETATQEARDRYLALVDELQAARQDVIDLRETTVWAQIYPHESLQTLPPSHELAPSKRIRERVLPRGDLLANNVFELFREDIRYFASVSTREQAAAARGVSERELAGDQAMWHESDEYAEWAKNEKQRLMDEYAPHLGQPAGRVRVGTTCRRACPGLLLVELGGRASESACVGVRSAADGGACSTEVTATCQAPSRARAASDAKRCRKGHPRALPRWHASCCDRHPRTGTWQGAERDRDHGILVRGTGGSRRW
jgi:hypothetical protein